MHDIWNPWHGCRKISEGCANCYMYFLDKVRDQDGSRIYKTNNFYYPLSKTKEGVYRIKSGEMIRVCMTSDFFLEEADSWRPEAWSVMRERSDVIFFLLTKRPERVLRCLPSDWNEGWENIFFNVSAENQRRADERIPILLELPFKHKGIMCAPLIGSVSIEKYLVSGKIEQVIAGGENYEGSRPCDFDWIKQLRKECENHGITFAFIETGTIFIKDGREYRLKSKSLQSLMAYKSGMSYKGKEIKFSLRDTLGFPLGEDELYKKRFKEYCKTCGSLLICNGCSFCATCHIKENG